MCKLIWPLWSSHIFTQWGWLISLDHFSGQHKNGENPPNTSLPQNLLNRMDTLSVHSLRSNRNTTPWGKPSNLWTSWVYSLRPRVSSWTWIRCMESATHRNTFMSPLTFALSTATRNFAPTSNYIIPVLKQQTQNLLHLWRCIIPLRHLAAKNPSQLHNYFLPSFLRNLQHRSTLYSCCH